MAIVILSFYVGILEGRRGGETSVTLSCSDDVLKGLAIKAPIEAMEPVQAPVVPQEGTTSSPEGMFAGSKNGTKYYTPGCPGLDRIKAENIIWFKDAQDATLQGYTAAAC